MNTPPRQYSPLAVVSLVCGILGVVPFTLVASVIAVVTGHLARAEIGRAPERFDGDGMAVAGLVLGYLVIGVSVLAVLVFVLLLGGLAWLGIAAGG